MHIITPLLLFAAASGSIRIDKDAARTHGQDPFHIEAKAETTDRSGYVRPDSLAEEDWNELFPLFLPYDTTERVILDGIFSKRRVLSSFKSMSRSGFILITDPKHKIIVAKHPRLEGFLFKIFLDSEDICEHYWWRKRVTNARTVQEAIDRYGYGGIMKTPKKWIYPLPHEPEAAEGAFPKHFILVVEEMDILGRSDNRSAYKTMMTEDRLDAFYRLLVELKLLDSVYADNTPFCKDGRMAFIDTEHSMATTQPIPLSAVGQYLSPDLVVYWEQLLVNGL